MGVRDRLARNHKRSKCTNLYPPKHKTHTSTAKKRGEDAKQKAYLASVKKGLPRNCVVVFCCSAGFGDGGGEWCLGASLAASTGSALFPGSAASGGCQRLTYLVPNRDCASRSMRGFVDADVTFSTNNFCLSFANQWREFLHTV